MRKVLPLLLTLVATFAYGQATDLAVTSLTLTPSSPMAGERVQVQLRVRNNGPVAPPFAEAVISTNAGLLILPSSASGQFGCAQTLRFGDIRCSVSGLGVGAEAEITATVLAPNRTDAAWTIRGSVFAGDVQDPDFSNNQAAVTVTLRSATSVDVKTKLEGPNLVQANTTARMTYQITNSGTTATGPVYVHFTAINLGSLTGLPASGTGWQCSEIIAAQAICSRSSLAAGQTSDIAIDVKTPPRSDTLTVFARTFVEGIEDPVPNDNTAVDAFEVATTLSWEPILIPITRPSTPGAFNSEFRTETVMLVESDNALDVRPKTCTTIACPPSRIPFDPYPLGIVQTPEQLEGQLVWVPEGASGRLRVQTRVYDTSRGVEWFGVEVPAVRASEFTPANTATVLLNVPVTQDFRHTLRIYDPSATPNRLVSILVYVPGQTNSVFEVTRRFEVPANNTGGPNGLPLRPGFIQFSSAELSNLGGAQRIYYRIAPADFDARLWAFISVTNNTTQEITLITP